MLTRTQKQQAVTELKDQFTRSTSVFVADYRGLSVDQVNDLRTKLRAGEADYAYRVAKNSLLKRASEGLEQSVLTEHFVGPTAVAFSFGDPAGLAKVLVDYANDNEAFELKGGFLDGKPLGQTEIATLATLPSKLIGLIQAPATKIAGVLQAPAGQLARVVEARRAALAESEGGA